MYGWRMLSCLAQDESAGYDRVASLLHKGLRRRNERVDLRREVCDGYRLREQALIGVVFQAKSTRTRCILQIGGEIGAARHATSKNTKL